MTSFMLCTTKYYPGDQMKNEMGGACGMHGERSGAYRVLVEKSAGQRPLETHRYK